MPGARVLPPWGALTCAVVAGVEATAALVAAVLALLSGLGSGGWALGAAVAAAAGGVAYLLLRVSAAWWRGRTWQRGIFVTVQLLVALVALSVGSPALLSPGDAPRVALLTGAALLAAVTGLVGAAAAARVGPAGGAPRERPAP
ncbi:hypothetical protein [Aquipuribacter nitratireducens]|uniref:Uncharacterized protein n=1 Tax=Aquipuribacter nitratireducens TaxID=650104 RepID=A0ABW0GTE2_9MICO